jgi:type I pantothenate kinase
VLEERGILDRKGFPESYDQRALLDFVAAVKSGHPQVEAPVYSHEAYDIIPGATTMVAQPDIVIVEGLNVLLTGEGRVVVSDFFDFSVYVDAEEADIRRWYVDRFMTLRETLFRDPHSYFHRYSDLSDSAAYEVATTIWDTINGLNLKENILPTRERAHLIVAKDADHSVRQVRLRRI